MIEKILKPVDWLAGHIGIDMMWFRIAFVVFMLVTKGFGLALYLVILIAMFIGKMYSHSGYESKEFIKVSIPDQRPN